MLAAKGTHFQYTMAGNMHYYYNKKWCNNKKLIVLKQDQYKIGHKANSATHMSSSGTLNSVNAI